MTPREVALAMQGAALRLRRDQALAYSSAQLMGWAFHQPAKMPAFDKVFPDPAKPAKSPADMLAAMRAFAADHNHRIEKGVA